MSHSNELKKVCEKLNKSLDQLETGVVSHEDKISVEEEILHLKETAEFINSKIKVINVSDVPAKEKNYENFNIDEEKSVMLNRIINSQISDDAVNTNFERHALEFLKQNNSKDVVFKNYKQKVEEQIELLKENCKRTLQLYERKEEILNETLKVSMLIKEKQNTFKDKQQEKSVQYQKECQENISDTYKEQMAKINQRIQKINFMKVLIKRLIFADIHLKEQAEFRELLKDTRSPVSIDSLLKE